MRKSILVIAALTVAIMATPAAAQNKNIWGTIIGGAGGGYLGSMIGSGSGRLAATAAGALLGAAMGNNVGTSLNRADAQYQSPYGYGNRRVVYQTVPAYWGPGNIARPYERRVRRPRRHRRIVVVQQAQNTCASGYTREYQTVVTVGGKQVPAFGRVCYMADGSWQKMPGLNH